MNSIDYQTAQARAMNKLITAEELIIQAEQEAAARWRSEQQAQAQAARSEAEARAVSRLSELRDAYTKRRAAFEKLTAALDEFYQIDGPICQTLLEVQNTLPWIAGSGWQGGAIAFQELRARAGIPRSHFDVGSQATTPGARAAQDVAFKAAPWQA